MASRRWIRRSLLTGLILALITGVMIALALSFAGLRTFGERARIVVLFALAATMYLDLGQPIFNHYGWGYFIFAFLADFIGLSAAGLVIARWFMPKRRVAADPAATPPLTVSPRTDRAPGSCRRARGWSRRARPGTGSAPRRGGYI